MDSARRFRAILRSFAREAVWKNFISAWCEADKRPIAASHVQVITLIGGKACLHSYVRSRSRRVKREKEATYVKEGTSISDECD